MSNPQNALANFRSYSALHSLVMCDGIKTANLLHKNSQMFSSNPDNPELVFDVQTIKDPSGEEDSEGKYIVLFDGGRDANFFIKSVSWETILAPRGPQGQSKFETIETEGEMIVEEPFGIDFLEVLVKGTHEMGVDPSSVVFMLKTYFVGIDDNGDQKIIDNVLPFTFIMIDLTAEMKASGSVYKISLFGTSNGVSKLPQISALGNGLSLKLKKGDPLRVAIAALETALLEKYESFKQDLLPALAADIRKTTGTNLDDADDAATALVSDKFVDVKYKLILDDDYVDEKYVVGTNKSHDTVTEDDTFVLKMSERASVESCIQAVMKACEAVTDEGTEDKAKKSSFSPKIVTSLVEPDVGSAYQIDYYIRRYETVYQPTGENFVPDEGEFIEFDYIYTGKNIDILDYDIKMDMGLSFFQTNIAPKGAPSTQAEQVSNANAPSGTLAARGVEFKANSAAGTDKIMPQRKAPLFLGATVPPTMYNNDINQLKAMSFEQSLARHAALENIQARVKIVGNPSLLNETLSSDFSGKADTTTDQSTGLPKIYSKPGFVKININYPATKELTGVKKFWYDGYFSIFSIENNFTDGVFTQTLDLFSLPASSALPKDTADQALTDNATPENEQPDYEVSRATELTNANKSKGNVKIGFDAGSQAQNLAKDPYVNLWFKSGVRFSGSNVKFSKIDPVIENIFDDIVAVWAEHTDIKPVVTSGNDSRHGKNSLHFKNLALDLRVNNLHPTTSVSIDTGRQIARDLAIRIGNEYDVIYENFPGNYPNNHIHVEYDPKPFTEYKQERQQEEGNG